MPAVAVLWERCVFYTFDEQPIRPRPGDRPVVFICDTENRLKYSLLIGFQRRSGVAFSR